MDRAVSTSIACLLAQAHQFEEIEKVSLELFLFYLKAYPSLDHSSPDSLLMSGGTM